MNAPMLPASLSYAELRKVNVSEFVEKKNNLSYLSWAWAVDQLLQRDPAASWEYRWHENKPFVSIGETAMVFCTVKAFGTERTAFLPVMDYKNRPIPNPNSFEVNTAMQRALAKAISLHGLGLYIYAGEDLPPGEEGDKDKDKEAPQKPSNITPKSGVLESLPLDLQNELMDLAYRVNKLAVSDPAGALAEIYAAIPETGESRHERYTEMRVGLDSLLDSKTRSALTKYRNSLKEAA